MTPDRAIETAADYADAMMTARSAKNLLVLLVLLMLLVQLAIFFVARYKPDWIESNSGGVSGSTTSSAVEVSASDGALDVRVTNTARVLQYITGLIDFLGVVLSIVLAMVLFLVVMIMLVGRLIGVSRLTAAFIWCLILVAMLFPWQSFLNNTNFTADFKIPGVLYTWAELMRNAHFGMDVSPGAK